MHTRGIINNTVGAPYKTLALEQSSLRTLFPPPRSADVFIALRNIGASREPTSFLACDGSSTC